MWSSQFKCWSCKQGFCLVGEPAEEEKNTLEIEMKILGEKFEKVSGIRIFNEKFEMKSFGEKFEKVWGI